MTITDALQNEDARALINCIEDMRSSWDGESRYADEIANCVEELFALTGYRYTF